MPYRDIPRPVRGIFFWRVLLYADDASLQIDFLTRCSRPRHRPDCGWWGTFWFAYAVAVPIIEAGVGAVATQALANTGFGPKGLALLT
jgi:Family of unknown function (DUF1028)